MQYILYRLSDGRNKVLNSACLVLFLTETTFLLSDLFWPSS